MGLMPRLHRHEGIELMVIWEGYARYLFGGSPITLPPDRLSIRWGEVPHGVTYRSEGTYNVSLRLPASWVLQLGLPDRLIQALLQGHFFIDAPRTQPATDRVLCTRWHEDLASGVSARQQIAMIEIQARLGRFAYDLQQPDPQHPITEIDSHAITPQAGSSKADQLAAYLTQHANEPITVADAVHHVQLDASYASRLFKKTFGITAQDYLSHQRISNAQRLLVTTNHTLAEISSDCGFNALNRFHAAFKKIVGMTPAQYRRSMR